MIQRQRAPDPISAAVLAESGRLEALESFDILETPREEAFDRIARLIRNIFQVRIALVSVLDAHRQWFKACQGLQGTEAGRSGAFCNITIAGSAPVIVPDTLLDPRFAESPHVLGEPHVRFYAGIPLRTRDGYNIGTLCAVDPEPRDFGFRETEILFDLAQLTMDELELRKVAAVDSLTGALSRRAFRQEGDRATALALRHKQHLACIAFDLDHFKSVNDTFGHPAGDKVLSAVVDVCMRQLRQSDPLGRMGGEEFAVLLPHTDRRGALGVAEKLRSAIEGLRIDIGEESIGVTASFGVSAMDIATRDIDALMSHADNALYGAKKAGRNRTLGWQRSEIERGARRRVLKAGLIRFDSRASTIDCTVRSLSTDGAGLDVTSSLGVPEHFTLLIRSDGFEASCRTVFQTETHLEVQFI